VVTCITLAFCACANGRYIYSLLRCPNYLAFDGIHSKLFTLLRIF
jgi:hypothetical protein